MEPLLLPAAALIALASAIFHGYVGGKIYMGHIRAGALMPLTQSLSLVSWHMFTTIFTGQRWHIDLCRNETASSAAGLSGFGGQCAGSRVVYVAGRDGSRNIIQTARNVPDGNDRIAGVAWAICDRALFRIGQQTGQ